MKKKIILALTATLASASMMAGGLLTNTNQNASFLRQMSQDGIIDITGLYANPAGTAFLSPGLHLSLNIQSAKQSRDITTSFPLFAYNRQNPQATHRFDGDALAPVIPSLQLSYNWDSRWSVNAAFALGGGGGKCEFDQGLGTFEALYASQIYSGVVSDLATAIAPSLIAAGVPVAQVSTQAQAAATAAFRGYDLNAYMKGRSYQFGLTLGGTYKIMDNLSAFVGLRGVFATNNYNGWVTDVKAYYQNPADGQMATTDLSANSLDLNADQTGFGVTPIIGMDWQVDSHWNLAFKFELPTHLSLKNKTEMNAYTAAVAQTNPTLGQFADGRSVREDVPGIIAAGAQYKACDRLRLMAGWHYYMDCQAKKEGDKQELIDKGTLEFSAGAEYDVMRRLTLSASWQCTRYRLSDEYMNDLSFNLSSNAIGVGLRFNASEHLTLDFGYMHNFYQTRNVDMTTAAGTKHDHYYRSNRVFGIGANLSF
ncbi:MAG: hypothetical protein K5945_11650 [Bacteroidaceae bacterium]|nr:hypothetical protein [Bacteroidaceae bacterium]